MNVLPRVDRLRATSPWRARQWPGGLRGARVLAAVAALLAAGLLASARGSAPSDLTPDQQQLLHRVRDNIARDQRALAGFTYTLERRSYDVNLVGKVSNGDVLTYEVGPSPFEPGRTWRRLVAVNGQRLSPERLRKDEQKAKQEAEERRRERESETTAAKALRVRREQEEQQRDRERLADIERAFRFAAIGEGEEEGRRVVGFELAPRPDAQTASDIGRHLDKLRGRLWVDPEQAQLARAEFETTGDITYGYGVIGRVSTGSRVSYRRVRAADGTWVPAEARFQGSGRTLMLIPFTLETWAKYADFRPLAPAASPGQAGPLPR